MLGIYGGRTKALMTLFPDLGWDKSRFYSTHTFLRLNDSSLQLFQDNHWESAERRKSFFLHFASTHSFNPLVPEPWYSVKTEDILSEKVFYLLAL